MANRILILEDDIAFGTMLEKWFGRNGFIPMLVSSMDGAKKAVSSSHFDLILSDLRLPDGDGIIFLSWLRDMKYTIPLIIMTSYGEVQTAVSAIKLGAADFLEKPVNPIILKQKIDTILAAPDPVKPPVKQSNREFHSRIEGESAAARLMSEYIDMVAPTNMSVLITGESGTGKEIAAKTIHSRSKRSGSAFIAVDCGSLSRELAPSEFFGHIKGSFTTAISDKKGFFELAHQGTLFLDEIGNLPYEVQVQLLRAVQEKKIRPVGASHDIPIDVRLICATNEDIPAAIAEGKFREDLYHRINEFTLAIPPLRERQEDIIIFANHFCREAALELEKPLDGFSPEVENLFMAYPWKGNIRELRNTVRRAALFARARKIEADNLPADFSHRADTLSTEKIRLDPGSEKKIIEDVLMRCGGSKTKAARLLGIDRKTLYNKIHKYGIGL